MKTNYLYNQILSVAAIGLVCVLWPESSRAEAEPSAKDAGGWAFELSSQTNHYAIGEKVAVFLVISNTTLKTGRFTGYSTDWGTGKITPNFGNLLVTNLSNGNQLKRKPPGSGIIAGTDRGGGINPHNSIQFVFNLSDEYELETKGRYQVCFRGKLDSITDPGKQIEFKTEALVLTIESPKQAELHPDSTPPRNQSTNAGRNPFP